MRFKGARFFALTVFAAGILSSPDTFSAEKEATEVPSGIEVIGTTHTIAAFNSLSGPGAGLSNVPYVFDLTMFEYNWGGRQTAVNGSGITTNTNYPLTEGDAVTHNTQIGIKTKLSDAWKAGAMAELYALGGDRTVGRVFGAQLPWDGFERENGALETPHFAANFYHAFLEGDHGKFKHRFVGGTLPSSELPEFSVKETNQVRLGSLVWRLPMTNNSFFQKEEHKLIEGRHPIRGFDYIADYEYAEGRHVHGEFFGGSIEPSFVSDLERDAFGGRVAADLAEGQIGVTFVENDGLRPGGAFGENQNVWSIDSSYRILPKLTPYLTFAGTDYEQEATGESHTGEALVAGVAYETPWAATLKGQYQRVDENYDLMAYHKTEHYPSNFEGFQGQAAFRLTDDLGVKGVFYLLEQIERANPSGDMLFGDSYYSAAANSEEGTIRVERIEGDWKALKDLSLFGYIEHAKFRKESPLAASQIDKDAYNFKVQASYKLTKDLALEAGFRRGFWAGNWGTMNFESYQDWSEAALNYKLGKHRHALVSYRHINFEDDIAASLGRNDYEGHQVILEIKTEL